MLLTGILPSIEAGPPNTKIPACFASIANLLGMQKHLQFTLNVAFVIRLENFRHPRLGNLPEVSRKSVRIYKRKFNRRIVLRLARISASSAPWRHGDVHSRSIFRAASARSENSTLPQWDSFVEFAVR